MVEELIWTQGATSDLQGIYIGLEDNGAEQLLERIEASLSLLKAFPKRGPKHRATIRKLLVGRKNRYGLFYSIEGKRIVVVAIADLRQDPRTIEKLLRDRTNSEQDRGGDR